MKTWAKVAIVLSGLIIVGILAIAYLGFIPFLSDVMGTNKAADLGVKYTAADSTSASDKFNTLMNTPGGATVTLTDSELTALINDKASKSSNIPLDNTQVRINSDGTLDVTGNLDMGKLQAIASSNDISPSTKSLIETIASVVKTDPSFSAKTSLEVRNSELVPIINEMKLGNLALPQDQMAAQEAMLEENIKDYMASSGLSFDTIQSSAGSLSITTKTP
jgi:hypothetical protein